MMERVSALTEVVEQLGAPGREDRIPVLAALRPVVPGGGLRPGSTVCLDGAGAATLGLALVAGAAQGDGWCAAVGMPEFGVVAAVQMGADPERLLLVDSPGERWPDVVAALAEAVDLVLVRPPEPPGAAVTRRLAALTRRHGCALVVPGAWEGAQLRLRVATARWTGLGDGHGHLRGRRAEIVAEGRGVHGAGARTWVWLPGPDGRVTPDESTSRTGTGSPAGTGTGLGVGDGDTGHRPSLEVVA